MELETILAKKNLDIELLKAENLQKDTKIARLMELAIIVDRLRKHRMNTDYLDAMDMAKMIVKERGK